MLAVEEKNPGSIFDRSFIESYFVGFDAFIEELRGSDLRGIEAASGLTREQIREAARIAAESNRIICCGKWGSRDIETRSRRSRKSCIFSFSREISDVPEPEPVRSAAIATSREIEPWGSLKAWARRSSTASARVRVRASREEGFDTVNTVKAMRESRVRFFWASVAIFFPPHPVPNSRRPR